MCDNIHTSLNKYLNRTRPRTTKVTELNTLSVKELEEHIVKAQRILAKKYNT
jgi:hypothetical protein